ncbi:histidinol phosphate phosphatase domain-containing protein [Methanosphaerula palustris]|uniref:PHP domain protein n=1 Tax=Methanosphaerula palustris (strain ATCC BAA-1556 / DSM 19958 / E1-9c) TaxID=521011 RepID=B8GJR1_METPE|nr:histidinol phosphate phosphatase domain-containing protein [Methanosphaerula palustris]ACL15715.1 PHP domain protein [Methanosphaerula palustris E1-9c]
MTGLYDLHTHTTLSDGEMLPLELLRRMSVLGYTTVAIADHVDTASSPLVLPTVAAIRESARLFGIRFLPAVEITHVPPEEIHALAQRARKEGAEIVVVHGETVVEPVPAGTNHAACICRDVDILAHPGLITDEDAALAAANNVALEITSRGGHNRTNGHVVRVAQRTGCRLVVNSDAHAPHDLLSAEAKMAVARGAGLSAREAEEVLALNIEELVRRP